MDFSVKPSELNVGDVFYECQSGYNIKCKVLTRPEFTEELTFGKLRRHWKWFAENACNSEKIAYGFTEGLEHYGPRLYSEPQYMHFKDGTPIFMFVGENSEKA